MRRVVFELIFRQTHRLCVGATVDHVIITHICALPVFAAAGFGGFFVLTDGAACPAVIGIAAMDVDADVMAIHLAN